MKKCKPFYTYFGSSPRIVQLCGRYLIWILLMFVSIIMEGVIVIGIIFQAIGDFIDSTFNISDWLSLWWESRKKI